MATKTKQTFEEWLAKVDAMLTRLVGLSHDDLPDVCYRDWYDDGVGPATAARKAVKNANE